MKKLYIKFDVNWITLDAAIREAVRLGYTPDRRSDSLFIKNRKELLLCSDWMYCTNYTAPLSSTTPEDEWYEEHTIINSSKYYVLVENRWEPRTIHPDFLSADTEAQRLARLERKDTYVLKIEKKYGIEIVEKNI